MLKFKWICATQTFLWLFTGTLFADTEITSLPYTCSIADERYYLTQDLSSAGNGVTISASGVTLDLQGNKITFNTSAQGAAQFGIYVNAGNAAVTSTTAMGYVVQGAGADTQSVGVRLGSCPGSDISSLFVEMIGELTYNIGTLYNTVSTFTQGRIHHCFVKNASASQSSAALAPEGIRIEDRGTSGIEVDHIYVLGAVRGINFVRFGRDARLTDPDTKPILSKLHDCKIQHARAVNYGNKGPYGICMDTAANVQIYDTEIISDAGRGIYISGGGEGVSLGPRWIDIDRLKIDVQYSQCENTGAYISNSVYGVRQRYVADDVDYNDVVVLADNSSNCTVPGYRGYSWGFFIGNDSSMTSIEADINNSTAIARKSGNVRGTVAGWAWDSGKAADIDPNSKYLSDDNVTHCINDGACGDSEVENSINFLSFNNNGMSAVTGVVGKPEAPTGVFLRVFDDNYVLEWPLNTEPDVFEYRVYKDASPISESTRGGSFYIDADVTGEHVYYVTAIDIDGNESLPSNYVSTADAVAGFGIVSFMPNISITSPTSIAVYQTTAMAIQLEGSATDQGGAVRSVYWSCSTCSPTDGSATPNDGLFDGDNEPWRIDSLALSAGDNVITVNVVDNDNNAAEDIITVTSTGHQDTDPAPSNSNKDSGGSGCFIGILP